MVLIKSVTRPSYNNQLFLIHFVTFLGTWVSQALLSVQGPGVVSAFKSCFLQLINFHFYFWNTSNFPSCDAIYLYRNYVLKIWEYLPLLLLLYSFKLQHLLGNLFQNVFSRLPLDGKQHGSTLRWLGRACMQCYLVSALWSQINSQSHVHKMGNDKKRMSSVLQITSNSERRFNVIPVLHGCHWMHQASKMPIWN